MSCCEAYARGVVAALEPLLRPAGGERLSLPAREPQRDPLWERSRARFGAVCELLEGEDAALLAFGLCVAVWVYPEMAVHLRRYAHIEAVTLEAAEGARAVNARRPCNSVKKTVVRRPPLDRGLTGWYSQKKEGQPCQNA